jgi:hypothetical protein
MRRARSGSVDHLAHFIDVQSRVVLLFFGRKTHAFVEHKSRSSFMARPERFELLAPRFVALCQPNWTPQIIWTPGRFSAIGISEILSVARCKFLAPPPESASSPSEQETWPQNSESPFTTCRSSRQTFSKNIASTSRSIRGSGLPPGWLQALWREDRALSIDGKRRKLSSRISEAAGKGGGNFLTPEIAHIAPHETAYREIGALIDAERLANMNSPRVSLQLRIQLVAVETTMVLEDRCNLSRRSELNSTAG